MFKNDNFKEEIKEEIGENVSDTGDNDESDEGLKERVSDTRDEVRGKLSDTREHVNEGVKETVSHTRDLVSDKVKDSLEFSFGPFKSPLFLAMAIGVIIAMYMEVIPTDMIGGLAVMVTLGWLFQTIGNQIPYLNKLGAGTLLPLFIPALMVYFEILPQNSIDAITFVIEDMNFTDLFVFTLIAGSILNLNRDILVKGFRSIIPLIIAGILGGSVLTSLIGMLLGFSLEEVFFYIVGGAMPGGIAVGSLPLADGYAMISGGTAGDYASYLVPTQILASLIAVIGASLLNQFGNTHSEFSGEGQLMRESDDEEDSETDLAEITNRFGVDASFARGAFFVLVLGVVCTLLEEIFSFPKAVFAIILCVVLNLTDALPQTVVSGSSAFSQIISSTFNAGVLAAIGVVHLDIAQMLDIMSVPYFLVILSLVAILGSIGFILGNKLGMYPIESSILSLNQVAMGGSGNIAILSGGEREDLMPFSQVITRFSGASVLTIWLLLFRVVQVFL